MAEEHFHHPGPAASWPWRQWLTKFVMSFLRVGGLIPSPSPLAPQPDLGLPPMQEVPGTGGGFPEPCQTDGLSVLPQQRMLRAPQRGGRRMPTNRHLPERPPTSIFFRFLASRMQTVSFPAVGTYRREMQISPSFSGCQAEQGADIKALPVHHTAVLGHGPACGSPQTLLNLRCRHELAPRAPAQGFDHLGLGQASPSTALKKFILFIFVIERLLHEETTGADPAQRSWPGHA